MMDLDFSLPDTQIIVEDLISQNLNKRSFIESVSKYISTLRFPKAPDFVEGLEWFNVSENLSFAKNLKGKVILLDFFTYCCINCMHILPDLKKIEEEFSVENGLVVIGVHSAKFENEKKSENILSAVQRYNITHPVVNDCNATMWNKLEVSCWPTLLVIGPEGEPLLMLMGEGHRDTLVKFIEGALVHYKALDKISNHSLPLKSAFHLLPDLKGPLLFPGKMAACPEADLLAISDTGNHRILMINSQGEILQQIGGRAQGYKNGSLTDAEFDSPQGLAFLNQDVLFVADTENHAIRKINLKRQTVETLVGTGKQGSDYCGGTYPQNQAISSPWDLVIYRTFDLDMSFHPPGDNVEEKIVLLIAMAGTHQIWAFFLDTTIWWKLHRQNEGTCIAIAGSGKEENRNNEYPTSAAFAQPSGLAVCKSRQELYIADSESSSVRRVSLTNGKVTAVVGGDRNPSNLFSFGDVDGKLYEAKLQHPLGLAMHPEQMFLYVSDTYNHKVKVINIETNTIKSVEWKNAEFNEPGGLCVSHDGKLLYVVDTNNHAIKVLDLATSTCRSLRLKPKAEPVTERDSAGKAVVQKSYTFSPTGGKLTLSIILDFKNGLKLTADAKHKFSLAFPNELWSSVPISGACTEQFEVIVSVPATEAKTSQSFAMVFQIIVCKKDLCMPVKCKAKFIINFEENSNVTNLYQNVNVPIAS